MNQHIRSSPHRHTTEGSLTATLFYHWMHLRLAAMTLLDLILPVETFCKA